MIIIWAQLMIIFTRLILQLINVIILQTDVRRDASPVTSGAHKRSPFSALLPPECGGGNLGHS